MFDLNRFDRFTALRLPYGLRSFSINGLRLSIARTGSYFAFGSHHWSVVSTSWFCAVRRSPVANFREIRVEKSQVRPQQTAIQ